MREEQYRFTFCNETKLYKRVTKPEAKKFYCSGTDVVLLPCNMNGESPWASPYIINVHDEYKYYVSFDYIVSLFESYNCSNEVGNYAKYFIPVQN